ncbi:hypothetical protein JM18_003302 [Phytophthora kernoviae]|uniref:Mitochondrial carrier protein n=2 Tax=Phytophthora kernoviae TaxID=325452 RepID=A0A921VC88_9STRA|nr:hypothetical protein G195_004414 [Phytophthora kernoviae 00238/432]KAG2528351.1 hypothetical protein JM18_003302 [Phytophthora kernoviae]
MHHSSIDMNDTLQTTLATTCYVYAGLPFDVVKLRMQTQGREGMYKGVLGSVRRIAKEEGLRALGRGGTPGLTSSLLQNPVTVAASGAVKKTMMALQLQKQATDGELSLQLAVELSIAQIFVSTVITIPENVKCKLQFQQYRGPLGCVMKIAKSEGVRGLFRGYSSVLLRDIPSGAVTSCAMIASFVLLYPADVVKSNMQTASSSKALTLCGTFRSVYRQHGLRGFYHGGSAAALSTALSFSAFLAVLTGVGRFDE